MEFNKLIPELTVKDIKRTREFYLNILQFKIEYERVEDKFMFLSLKIHSLCLKNYEMMAGMLLKWHILLVEELIFLLK